MSTGRQVLVAVYAVFALAAGARSVVQLLTKGDEAPLAYTLSLLAAVIYLVATLALRRTTARAHRVAFAACAFELVGVLTVGDAHGAGSASCSRTRPSGRRSARGTASCRWCCRSAGLWWLVRHPVGPDVR